MQRFLSCQTQDHRQHDFRGGAKLSPLPSEQILAVGAVYNSGLRKQIPPERHLIFNYVGPASPLLSEPQGPHQYNQYSLNKTESISLTYEALRRKRIRCFDFQLAESYLADFLNLFRAPGESQSRGAGGGGTTFLYRSHPTKPNDALMATVYGFMLG